MKLILTGTIQETYESKTVEINGNPVLNITGTIKTDSGDTFPIMTWGETKGKYWKEFAENGEHVQIVAELQAKPQTYTNHEGETVTVPNLQLKLYSFLNLPKWEQISEQVKKYNENPIKIARRAGNFLPPVHMDEVDPTGCFISMDPEQKKEELKTMTYSYAKFLTDKNNVVPPGHQGKVPQWNISPNYYGSK